MAREEWVPCDEAPPTRGEGLKLEGPLHKMPYSRCQREQKKRAEHWWVNLREGSVLRPDCIRWEGKQAPGVTSRGEPRLPRSAGDVMRQRRGSDNRDRLPLAAAAGIRVSRDLDGQSDAVSQFPWEQPGAARCFLSAREVHSFT